VLKTHSVPLLSLVRAPGSGLQAAAELGQHHPSLCRGAPPLGLPSWALTDTSWSMRQGPHPLSSVGVPEPTSSFSDDTNRQPSLPPLHHLCAVGATAMAAAIPPPPTGWLCVSPVRRPAGRPATRRVTSGTTTSLPPGPPTGRDSMWFRTRALHHPRTQRGRRRRRK
jgi:hypothetical protein